MRRLLFLSYGLIIVATLLAVNTMTLAEIYKEIDKDGNIVYTDVPGKGKQKPVSVKPMTTYKPRSVTRPTSSAKPNKPAKKTTTTYSSLQISSPESGAAIRANSGVITVNLQSQPGLDTKAGHRYVILIDGQQRKKSSSASVSVDKVDRGSHSISAEIRDESDTVLASASPVQVTILRASVLFPGRR